jgi:hypothetical protein
VSAIPEAKSTTQKKTLRASQATSERVQLLRVEYWAQVTGIDLKDLVFLDEMGVLLGLMSTLAIEIEACLPSEFIWGTSSNLCKRSTDRETCPLRIAYGCVKSDPS